jgi:hypothetical protein
MEPNTNPDTGIRYGIISANSLNSDVIDTIQSSGIDVHYEAMRKELREAIKGICKDYMSSCDADEVAELAVETASQDFYDNEPVYEFEIDGVKGRTTWLGGALLVWIFESPFQTHAQLCSPCVPNCGDLDNLMSDEGGYPCYDVLPDWRDES